MGRAHLHYSCEVESLFICDLFILSFIHIQMNHYSFVCCVCVLVLSLVQITKPLCYRCFMSLLATPTPEVKGQVAVVTCCSGERREVRPGAPSEPNEYNFNFKRRGLFLLINNKKFARDTHLMPRDGSDVDAERLEERFQGLGFDVRRFDDVTRSKMMTLMYDGEFRQRQRQPRHEGRERVSVWVCVWVSV